MNGTSERHREREQEEARYKEDRESNERIERVKAQARIAQARIAAGPPPASAEVTFDEEALLERIDELMKQRIAEATRPAAAAPPASVDVADQVNRILAHPVVMGLLAKLTANTGPPGPAVSPYARFVPKGGGGGNGGTES